MAVDISFLASATSATSGANKTFAGLTFGAEAADREIIAVIGFSDSSGLSSNPATAVTIGGVAATQDGSFLGAGGSHCDIWRATIPTGASGDVVITRGAGGAITRWEIGLYRMTGCGGQAAYDTAVQRTTTSTGGDAGSLDVPANGAAILAVKRVSTTAPTFSEATNPFTVDTNVSSGTNSRLYAGYRETVSAITLTTAWTSGSGSGTSRVTLGVSYGAVPPAVLTSLSPTTGSESGGTAVTLTGTGFSDATGVEFDGVPATSVVVVNATTITCVTPPGTVGLADVTVLSPAGNSTLANSFTYTSDIPASQLNVTQLPLLVLSLAVQPVRVTQLPVLVAYSSLPPAAPLPNEVVPDVPVTETWSWLTTINVFNNGNEQRSALRITPRVGQSFGALILSEKDRREVFNLLRHYVDKEMIYPMYHYSTHLTAAASASDDRIYFNPALTDIRLHENIALINPQDMIVKYHTVAAVHSDGVTLASALGYDAGAYYMVSPAPTFRIPQTVGLGMNTVDGDLSLSMETTRPRDLVRPGSAVVLPTLFGYNLLDKRPLADADENFDKGTEWLDNGIGIPSPRSYWSAPLVSGKRSFLLNRNADFDFWRTFLDEIKGRRGAFLFPTYFDDLPLATVPALGANTLVTTNQEIFNYWRNPSYQYLRIETANGVIYRRINEVLLNFNAQTASVRLNAAIGGSVGDNVITRISHMYICRLGSDTVTLTHNHLNSILTAQIEALTE